MSYFSRMHIAFGRNVTESGGDFHTITIDSDHDSYILDNVVQCLVNADYEVMSVVVDGYDFLEDMWKHIKYASNIQVFFEALVAEPYCADTICAFITVNDAADADTWQNSIYISADDYESLCREWAHLFHKVYEETRGVFYDAVIYEETDPFPDYLVIDWEETVKKIARKNGSLIVEFNDCLYYFG